MELKSFDEWFAVRPGHSDELEPLNGRLKFDIEHGIRLETIIFQGSNKTEIGDIIGNETITGWLDYQRPTTIIRPSTQGVAGFTISVNTLAMRDAKSYVGNAILKNVFLENVQDSIFTGITFEHPAFHAWLNPQLVKSGWARSEDNGLPCLSVEIGSPKDQAFTLIDGSQAKVISAAILPEGEVATIEEYSRMFLRFPTPVNYDAIVRLTWRISTLFEFLIGSRAQAPVYQLQTNHRRMWNGDETEVTAELLYRPTRRKNYAGKLSKSYRYLTVAQNSPITVEQILNRCLGEDDELIFLADLIQSVEDHDLQIAQGYGELLGCLEAFDDRVNGSGADEEFPAKLTSLANLVGEHGSPEDKLLFERIKGGAPNKFSLLKRLERLQANWIEDGFRGRPRLGRIRDLRNLIPHGRGLEVSAEIAQEMLHLSYYLTALGRYHVMKQLGFTGDQVAAAFSWQAHRYGMFIPERMISRRVEHAEAAATSEVDKRRPQGT